MSSHHCQAVFIMEQQVGHRSYYENLRAYMDGSLRISPRWVEVTYKKPGDEPNRRSGGSFVGREQVRAGLRSVQYDIAFFNTQVPAALAFPLPSQKPYVLSTDITPIQYDAMAKEYEHSPDRFAPLAYIKHSINTHIFQKAAKILPWSNWAAESLVRDYSVDPDCIEVVSPGVDVQRWHPKHDFHDTFRILFVGGDFKRKGGDTLLDAFEQLPKGLAELCLVTRSPVAESPNVKVYSSMQPNSEALVALFQSADVFVLPTRAEAFGIVCAEAGAAGLPVIATNVGGVPDIVVDGETGFLISPEDGRGLAACLQKLIDEPALRRGMGQAGRSRVETRFNAQTNACRVEEILLEKAGHLE